MTEFDPALYDRLRRNTAEMLRYNLSDLSPQQKVRLDRAASLRLEIDNIQSRQLIGQPIDMAKFVASSEALERLIATANGDLEQSNDDEDGYGWRERLQNLLVGRLRAREYERDAVAKELTEKFPDPRIVAAVEAAVTVEPGQRQVRLIEAAAEIELLKIQIEQLQAKLATPLLLAPPAEPPVEEERAPAPWIHPNAGRPPPFVDKNPWQI